MSSADEHIKHHRRDFNQGELDATDLQDSPLKMFQAWMQEAVMKGVEEPNAMSVSTVDASGMPQSRIVYLRDVVEEGFIFYTNYQSNKGVQIAHKQKIAVLFFWPKLDRQIRITGVVEKIPAEMSDAYFENRPRQSQIGAWASPQSQPIANRQELLDNVAEYEAEFDGKEVTRPPHWGGYVISPQHMEFWQGRSARLHDRFLYEWEGEEWNLSRLAP